MTRYVVTYGARQAIVYATSEADARSKGANRFHVPVGLERLINVHLDKRN